MTENILVNGLYNLEFKEYLANTSFRYLGDMESALVISGFLTPGEIIDYNERTYKFLWFKFKEKETYRDYIIRKSKEYLKIKEII